MPNDLDAGGYHTADGLAQCPTCNTYGRIWTHEDLDAEWCVEPDCDYDTRRPTLFTTPRTATQRHE